MHIRYDLLGAFAVAFALCLASPAEAAKAKKNKRSAGAAHSVHQRHAGAAVRPMSALQGGVLAGPLYNGQEFLGDDPDPSIRAYILKDFGVRYGGAY
jgi:hypothetical protein